MFGRVCVIANVLANGQGERVALFLHARCTSPIRCARCEVRRRLLLSRAANSSAAPALRRGRPQAVAIPHSPMAATAACAADLARSWHRKGVRPGRVEGGGGGMQGEISIRHDCRSDPMTHTVPAPTQPPFHPCTLSPFHRPTHPPTNPPTNPPSHPPARTRGVT